LRLEHGHWRRICWQAKALAGNRCQSCGSPDDLTVDLDPRLRGDHRAATLANVRVLCRSCHGSPDAPRATRERRVTWERPRSVTCAECGASFTITARMVRYRRATGITV